MSGPLGLLVCEGQGGGVTVSGPGLGVDGGAILEMESKQGGTVLGTAGLFLRGSSLAYLVPELGEMGVETEAGTQMLGFRSHSAAYQLCHVGQIL